MQQQMQMQQMGMMTNLAAQQNAMMQQQMYVNANTANKVDGSIGGGKEVKGEGTSPKLGPEAPIRYQGGPKSSASGSSPTDADSKDVAPSKSAVPAAMVQLPAGMMQVPPRGGMQPVGFMTVPMMPGMMMPGMAMPGMVPGMMPTGAMPGMVPGMMLPTMMAPNGVMVGSAGSPSPLNSSSSTAKQASPPKDASEDSSRDDTLKAMLAGVMHDDDGKINGGNSSTTSAPAGGTQQNPDGAQGPWDPWVVPNNPEGDAQSGKPSWSNGENF